MSTKGYSGWDQYRFRPMACTFTPRESYCGRPLREDLREHIGRRLMLRALWLMDEGDKYPGEWALGSAAPDTSVFPDVYWIASGDVTVQETTE
jgi:hypothetical protein